MKYRTALVAAAGPLCLGLALSAGPGFAGTTVATSSTGVQKIRNTTFAFHASGFGSLVTGGQLPADSSTTAFNVIGCTNRAGRSRTNDIAEAKVPGLGTLSGIKTHVWTSERDGVVASHATHSVARLTLANSQLGSLSIKAIRSSARSWHDASGFHSSTSTSIGAISFTVGGQTQTFPAPTPDQPVQIPGVATIHAGYHRTTNGRAGAMAKAIALRVDVIPTGTSARISRSYTKLAAGLTFGSFHGHSNATRVEQALGGIAHSGPNPLSVMPCQGTGGHLQKKALASVDLGQVVVTGATSAQRSNQGDRKAHGVERAGVAQVSLGGGQVVLKGIVGKVTVVRTRHGMHRSIQGSTVGSVTAGGRTQSFPSTGVIEIPGVVRLERNVTTKLKGGIKVVAVRATLLDGSGAVVDLGEAQLVIHRVRH